MSRQFGEDPGGAFDPKYGISAKDLFGSDSQEAREEAAAKQPSRARKIKSLMEDSGYSRKEATVLVDAGFGDAA